MGCDGGIQRGWFCWHRGGGQVDNSWCGGGVCMLSFSAAFASAIGGLVATELLDVGSAVACWPCVCSVDFLLLVEQGIVPGG